MLTTMNRCKSVFIFIPYSIMTINIKKSISVKHVLYVDLPIIFVLGKKCVYKCSKQF